MHRFLFPFALSLIFVFAQQIHAQSTPAPTQDEFIDVDEEPVAIVPIEKLIRYPEIAKRSGLEGRVVLEALIEKDGSVSKVQVVKSTYDIFRDEAIRAMKEAKFTPARLHGVPLRIWITRSINFKLIEQDQFNPEYHIIRSVLGLSLERAREVLTSIGEVHQTKENQLVMLRVRNDQASAYQKQTSVMDLTAVCDATIVQEVWLELFYAKDEFDELAAHVGSTAQDFDLPDMTVHATLDSSKHSTKLRARKK